ncbi:Ribonuclease T2 precursor (RNase T2) [Knufia obscura]|uniref:ribonuclease T2 n=1 Tax=Knufia obscura TaxID=1635080 RepID=A0ABR0RP21_9EURO|nr:Ribonuclease T2 precursor (RNase T2) [Knufia obscura]
MNGSPAVCIPAISCSLPTLPALDSCCVNTPSGHFLQTQFWDTSPPLGGNETWTIHGLWPDHCKGGFDQYCDEARRYSPERIAGILSNASTPAISGSGVPGGTHPGLIEFMATHWISLDGRNANLWAHEWNKHGTCISTLEAGCYGGDETTHEGEKGDNDVLDYFIHATLLYTTLPTFDFFARHGIVPSYETTYELEHLRRAISDSEHGRDVTIRCRNHDELSEIWYSFNVRGDLRGAMDDWWGRDGGRVWDRWVPADPLHGQSSTCPATGIRYLPKDGQKPGPVPTVTSHTHTATATATATETVGPTARPFTGKGRLMVKVLKDSDLTDAQTTQEQQQDVSISAPIPSEYTGCLIRNGRWYAARSPSSCAIFTAHDDAKSVPVSTSDDDDNDSNYHLFTLASRLAPCSFVRSWESAGNSNTNSLAAVQHTQNPNQAVLHGQAKIHTSLPRHTFFSCAPNLPFQSILSNNATVDKQHPDNEAARRMTLGEEHVSVFWAEGVPRKNQQVALWSDGDETNGEGRGGRRVKVEVYWDGV